MGTIGIMNFNFGVEWEVSDEVQYRERHGSDRVVRRVLMHSLLCVSGVFTRDFAGENYQQMMQHQLVQCHQGIPDIRCITGLGLTIPKQISAAYLPSCKAACTVIG